MSTKVLKQILRGEVLLCYTLETNNISSRKWKGAEKAAVAWMANNNLPNCRGGFTDLNGDDEQIGEQPV